ncbi:MAG: type II toxin-antitoxin system VapC family toxin [bacterium]|nr:type II toxin-antitoxin system VapC family toxin [bacterium]
MTLPPRLFCDTSFFYACLDPSDANHPRAAELIEAAADSRTDFLTTWDIVSESATLLRYRHSFKAAWNFLSEVRPTLEIVHYGDGAREEAMEIFRLYGQDHRLSFCDALSFVVVTTLLDDLPCLAFDRDFRGLGLTVLA